MISLVLSNVGFKMTPVLIAPVDKRSTSAVYLGSGLTWVTVLRMQVRRVSSRIFPGGFHSY